MAPDDEVSGLFVELLLVDDVLDLDDRLDGSVAESFDDDFFLPCESMSDPPIWPSSPPTLPRTRDTERERESDDVRREPVEVARCRDGRTSFFCLDDAGRISSRSTGTPSETRKRRLIRERIQSGGCKGGGATS